MARILPFPSAERHGFQRIQASYNLRQISRQFGIPERYLRRWIDDGILEPEPGNREGELAFDIRALALFRSIRDRRSAGVNLKQVDADLRGQLSLFGSAPGIRLDLATRRSAFEQGLILFDQGQSGAEECFVRALAQGDHLADCHCNLGILSFGRGDTSRAVDEFSRALVADPRHLEAHYNLGNLYAQNGDLRLAELHYQAALKIEPGFADAWYNLGLLQADLGDLHGAAASLRTYCTLSDDSVAAGVLASIEAACQ